MGVPAVPVGPAPRKRVLVVDDDEPTARMLRLFLREYEVDVAFDGVEGLRKVIEHKPDLVIADVWMPQLDGIDMVRTLHEDPALLRLPVIFVSAAGDAAHVAAAIQAGARHFLTKPIQVEKLLGLVRRILD